MTKKSSTIKERLSSLETVVQERTKTIFEDIKDMKQLLKSLDDSMNNHCKEFDSRLKYLESDKVTRVEKWKFYGVVLAAIVTAVSSIIITTVHLFF